MDSNQLDENGRRKVVPMMEGSNDKPMPEAQAKAHGYVEQTPEASAAFVQLNEVEAHTLRILNAARNKSPGLEHCDPRWVSMAISDVEKAFMIARRALVKRPG